MCHRQKTSHRKRLRRRGAVCGVGAPLRCAEASPSSRLLASGPAALATPPHTLFQQPARRPEFMFGRRTQTSGKASTFWKDLLLFTLGAALCVIGYLFLL